MPTGDVRAGFAINVGYFFLAAAVLVFIATLALTLFTKFVSGAISMTIRTSSKTVSFARPFLLKGIDRVLAAGQYKVITDEELIEELSFPVYRRVATMIFVPADSQNSSSV